MFDSIKTCFKTKLVRTKHSHYYVCHLYASVFGKESLIGSADIRLDYEDGPTNGHIMAVKIVYEKWQGQGYGTKLMQEVVNKCREVGCLTTSLDVAHANPAAVKVYSKIGYIEVPNHPKWEGRGWAMRMLMDLRQESVLKVA